MSDNTTYQGGCFCGAVRFTLTGDAFVMGYCHCDSCRHWSAGPVNTFTLWQADQLTITAGEDNLAVYNKTPGSSRKWCKSCGGHVMNEHPHLGIVDMFAPVIEGFKFRPSLHVHYQETVLPMRDGLPKMKDAPQDWGGSGEQMAE